MSLYDAAAEAMAERASITHGNPFAKFDRLLAAQHELAMMEAEKAIIPNNKINPLLLPEIVQLVCSFLEGDQKTLFNCIFVNSIWADEATSVLWKTVSACNFMKIRAEKFRFRKPFEVIVDHQEVYARKIRTLVVTTPGDIMAASFPRAFKERPRIYPLVKINRFFLVCTGPHPKVHEFEPYLQRHLHTFSSRSNGDDELCKAFMERCPFLNTLKFAIPVWGLSEDMLVKVVTHLPLKSLSLLSTFGDVARNYTPAGTAYDQAITRRFLGILGASSLLQELSVNSDHSGYLLASHFFKNSRQSFRSLKKCSLFLMPPTLDTEAFITDLKPYTTLTHLNICFSARIYDALVPFSYLKHLEVLYLFFVDYSSITASSLIELAGECKNLSKLRLLCAEPCVHLHGRSFADNAMKGFAILAPNLSELYIYFNYSKLSVTSFLTLGRYCPNLQYLGLSGDFNFTSTLPGLANIPWPHFPKLENLHLTDTTLNLETISGGECLANQFLAYCPKLLLVGLGSSSWLQRYIERIYRMRYNALPKCLEGTSYDHAAFGRSYLLEKIEM